MIAPYGSRAHYFDHMVPTWLALPLEAQAPARAPGEVAHRLMRRGLRAGTGSPGRGELALVASGGDARALRPRTVALVEHGAGQAYDVADGGYSGGPGRDNVVLFLCPNETSARRNRAAYPRAAVEVVGSPRVEALRSVAGTSPDGRGEATGSSPGRQRRQDGPPAVALSFHFDSPMRVRVPEAGSALEHYRPGLERAITEMRGAGLEVLGHGHPRGGQRMARLWRRLGVEWVPDFADVVARASAYACDNSSTLYEAAACGIPVVVMNAPWYRRGLDAWPRFWRCADVGIQVDGPGALADALAAALEDPPEVAARRAEVVAEVYPLLGGAAKRSAHALLETYAAVASPR